MNDQGKRPFIEWSNLWAASNLLSMSRVVMLIPIVYFLLQEGETARWWAFFWIFLAVLTDNLDGRVARARNEITEEGKILDPLADKICVGVVIAVLALTGEIPLWFFALVVSRDVIIVISATYIKRKFGVVMVSNMIGKVAVTVIVATLAVMILPLDVPAPLIVAMKLASVAVIVTSLLSYAKEFFDKLRVAG
jgi:CDP-diacylglycerol--glycerol-3-phosphate 3-phosphatidyltransferase